MSVTVSGPGLDRKTDALGSGLSLASNHASAFAKRREEATFYVRDENENVIGIAESDGAGCVKVYEVGSGVS